ncbi:hypothetical protein CHU98_g6882 [Xylaria longipes]|nr:hypothetical protein CHU98_g6882 [Xylaria longipes]
MHEISYRIFNKGQGHLQHFSAFIALHSGGLSKAIAYFDHRHRSPDSYNSWIHRSTADHNADATTAYEEAHLNLTTTVVARFAVRVLDLSLFFKGIDSLYLEKFSNLMEKTKMTSPPITCLDVAIDHRIRRLCKPTWAEGFPEPSAHLSVLQQYGSRQGCDTDEIKVTSQLAGPAITGGILVTLQQPRDNYSFKAGFGGVVEECKTLTALDQLFSTALYVFEAARLTICAKRPDVVLCAGKIWLPYEERNLRRGVANQEKSAIKGELWKLESIGVGRPDLVDTVRFRGNGRELVQMSKVNGFHPSYAVNYYPEHINLKQLLLLNVVKTCGIYRGDWEKEEMWMNSLRTECRELTSRLRDEKQVTRQSRTLSDYARIYSIVQQEFIGSINKIESSQDQAVEDIYDNILTSRLSYKCNGASIVLRKVLKLSEKGWPETQDTDVVKVGMKNLGARFTDESSKVTFDLEMMAGVFLQMARSIEEVLGDLLEAKTTRHRGSGLSEQFTKTFQGLSLTAS